MGPVTAEMIALLGYDPGPVGGGTADEDAGTPDVRDLPLLPVGTVVRARDGARPVAVARLGSGKLVVVSDRCPHDGGRISDGWVDGERLVCARHGWELEVDPETKQCVRACKPRE